MELKNCGLAPRTLKAMNEKKLETVDDFLNLLPQEYYDLTHIPNLEHQHLPGKCIVKAHVNRVRALGGKYDMVKMSATTCYNQPLTITWFRQGYMYARMNTLTGSDVIMLGRVTNDEQYGYQMSAPEYIARVEDTPPVLPKRRKIAGVSKDMAETLWTNLTIYAQEELELPVLEHAGLWPKQELYKKLHFPATINEANAAMSQNRIRHLMYFAANMQNTYPARGEGYKFLNSTLADQYISTLPYPLTHKSEAGDGQQEAIEKLRAEMSSGNKLHMLIQGDVGCGKTTVAFYGVLLAVSSGYQAVIMAPTTVLAKQHYLELSAWVDQQAPQLHVTYLSGETTASQKKKAIAEIKDGTANIIIGTHSVISEAVQYNNLGIAIIDEEHKFGVEQREALVERTNDKVHVVTMSATPIPRSLATVLYGDGCQIVSIKTMPDNRIPVKTAITSSQTRVNETLITELKKGRQAYIVCPRVDIDEKTDKESAMEAAAKYKALLAPLGYEVSALHGKMAKNEIAAIIDNFKSNNIQVLVSTTVIEVGVNTPNATLIVVEDADMFGLSSLHQLRGRVGRGAYESFCLLKSTDVNNERLQAMYLTKDGFRIAEADLAMRGTGNLIGLNQSGSDKYIEMILSHPEEYNTALQEATWMLEHGYTNYIQEKKMLKAADPTQGLYKDIFAAQPISTILTDAHNRILGFNPAADQLLHLSSITDPDWFTALFGKQSGPVIQKAYQSLLAIGGSIAYEDTVSVDDSISLCLSCSASRLITADGTIAVVTNLTDITRIKQELFTRGQQADYDALTGILNRNKAESIISQVARSVPGMFGLLDVNKFKSINDTFGHAVGDQALIAVAQALKAAFRDEDIVMRLGGDEFAVYAKNITTEQSARKCANRLFKAIDEIRIPELQEADRAITISLGVTFSDNTISETFNDLYFRADAAMYDVKGNPGNQLGIAMTGGV